MGKNSITVHLDPELKAEADQFFATLGLSTENAVRLFLREALHQKRLPFSLNAPHLLPPAQAQRVKRTRARAEPMGAAVRSEVRVLKRISPVWNSNSSS